MATFTKSRGLLRSMKKNRRWDFSEYVRRSEGKTCFYDTEHSVENQEV